MDKYYIYVYEDVCIFGFFLLFYFKKKKIYSYFIPGRRRRGFIDPGQPEVGISSWWAGGGRDFIPGRQR